MQRINHIDNGTNPRVLQRVTFTLFSSREICSLSQQVFSIDREAVVLVVRKKRRGEEEEEAESGTEISIERGRRNGAEEGDWCDID